MVICDNTSHKDDWQEQHFYEFAERSYIQKQGRSDLIIILEVRKPRALRRLRRSDRVPQSSCSLGVRAWIPEFYGAFVSMARVRSRSVCGLLRARIKLIRRSHKLENQDHEKSRSDTTLKG